MDFTVTNLHKIEKDLETAINQILKASKTQNAEELNQSTLIQKMNKDTLANYVVNLSKLMIRNIDLCKVAAGTIDTLKTEQLVAQRTLIEQQQNQLDSVQNTVQTEMKTWSDIVVKNCETSAPSIKSVKKAVKSVVQDDARRNNFIVYGVAEKREDNPHELAGEILNEIWDSHAIPQVVAASKIGAKRPDNEKPRPVKVTLACPESVRMVLARARNLKKSSTAEYHTWYITPDRNKEEKAAHQKLVTKLKAMITTDSSKYHYIRDGNTFSVNKV